VGEITGTKKHVPLKITISGTETPFTDTSAQLACPSVCVCGLYSSPCARATARRGVEAVWRGRDGRYTYYYRKEKYPVVVQYSIVVVVKYSMLCMMLRAILHAVKPASSPEATYSALRRIVIYDEMTLVSSRRAGPSPLREGVRAPADEDPFLSPFG